MKIKQKHLLGFSVFIASLAVATILGGGRAHAATLNVSGSCTLPIAINSVNAGANQSGCTATGPAYATNDTINIPAGTQVLTANLPTIFSSGNDLTIQGASQTSTTIDMDGYTGFNSSDSVKYVIKDLKIENANTSAINFTDASEVVLDNVEVMDSDKGVVITAATIIISGCDIHHNTDTSNNASSGLRIDMKASISNDTPSVILENTKIQNNTANWIGGLNISQSGLQVPTSSTVTISDTEILDNIGEMRAGAQIGASLGEAPVYFSVSSTTVAGNTIVTQSDLTNANVNNNARIAGLLLNLTNLQPGIHLSNTTVANNSVTNNTDNQASIAGFFSIAIDSTVLLSQINTTVVDNVVLHPGFEVSIGGMPAFAILNVDVDTLTIIPGGSAQNSLIFGNTFNGVSLSCRNDFPGAFFGIPGTGDLTPINNGNNITDDSQCTDYDYQTGLENTVGELQYNGGNVQTMALLPGSPAIGAGGAVLGITSDARGVERSSSSWDVGAYQTVLGETTTDNIPGSSSEVGSLANTGQNIQIMTLLAGSLILLTTVSMKRLVKTSKQ